MKIISINFDQIVRELPEFTKPKSSYNLIIESFIDVDLTYKFRLYYYR